MSPPAERDAKHDRALRGTPLTVYLYLLEVLDFVEPRSRKTSALALELGIKEERVSRALKLLVDRGYLWRSPPQKYQVRDYRLYWSRANPPQSGGRSLPSPTVSRRRAA